MYLEKSVKNSKKSVLMKKIAIVAVWLMIWQAASMLTGLAFLLPGPVTVFLTLGKMLCTAEYYRTVLCSLCKIGSGFLLALAAGLVFGGLAGAYGLIKEFLEPLLLLMKALPVAAFIILVLMWFGSENAAVMIGFMVVFPMVYHAVIEGIGAANRKLLEMAHIFGVSWIRKLRYIYLPQMVPFLASSLKLAAGMCWKAGVSAEVIGLVRNSIGAQLYYTKLYLMTAELFAWSITIMLISFVFEKLLLMALGVLCRKICGGQNVTGTP